MDDASELHLRIVELETEAKSLKVETSQRRTTNEKLQAANSNLEKTLATVTPGQANGVASPKYVGRTTAPKLIPAESLVEVKPDMKAVNAALNSKENLVIDGIERRG